MELNAKIKYINFYKDYRYLFMLTISSYRINKKPKPKGDEINYFKYDIILL